MALVLVFVLLFFIVVVVLVVVVVVVSIQRVEGQSQFDCICVRCLLRFDGRKSVQKREEIHVETKMFLHANNNPISSQLIAFSLNIITCMSTTTRPRNASSQRLQFPS